MMRAILLAKPKVTSIRGFRAIICSSHEPAGAPRLLACRTTALQPMMMRRLFDSVWFAVEDFSALRYIHDKIGGTAFFEPLDLLADPDDPRDLFGMLKRADLSRV